MIRCTTYGGSCNNGQLADETSRRWTDHCGSCNTNYYLDDNICIKQPTCVNGQYLKGSSPTARGTCFTCSNATCPDLHQYRTGECSGTTNVFTSVDYK